MIFKPRSYPRTIILKELTSALAQLFLSNQKERENDSDEEQLGKTKNEQRDKLAH